MVALAGYLNTRDTGVKEVGEVRRDRSYETSLALARAVAVKLREDPALVHQKAVEHLPGIRANVQGLALNWVDEWAALIGGPDSALEAALLREDEHGADLRSVAPFAGTLTTEERLAALRTVYGK